MDTSSTGKSNKESILNFFKRKVSNSPPEINSISTGNANKVFVTPHALPHIETFETNVNENNKDDNIETNCISDTNILLPRNNDIALFINRSLNDEEKLSTRLNGLALLAIYRTIEVSPDEVINELSIQKNRKLDFVL
ncbi:uncharacterized protein LOC126903924 [Daktulosphaira vitifoliae]|uniref:uncharacterized protein LOC126903924 n=1 Tax=Daktulosphaira vitifoliae TaxID=58002 RepID=UPI0021AA96CF|nr:uncharacterized protein LOC126903924 [Daktulosphaira vitifoliae]